MHFYKLLLIALLFILSPCRLFATHYYGVDLFYTHVAGNTYRVTIVAFGDCSGQQFPTFSNTRPRIYINKGNTEFLKDYLDQEPPKEGIEVTAGCPAELKRSTCVDPNGTVPGVKKFIYSKEFTLSGPAPDWKFIYLGETDGTVIAGRSNSITNVFPVGVITLEATLDNTQYSNSSPQFSTVATQFYCINSPVSFNPGATDADGDNLVYELVSGLNGASPVTYRAGYSGNNPMAATPGTFNFSNSNGLLNYTPNLVQRSLVVYKISEYRNGILLGTVMREMTMIVLPCTNNAPVGYISNASGAAIVDSITVQTCVGNHEVAFDINPANNPNNYTVNMVVANLPAGSRLDITDNNTKQPKSRFVWNAPDLPEGDYTFYVTYTADSCTSIRRTQAYTIRIQHDNILAEATPASCTTLGRFNLVAPSSWVPWSCKIYKDLEPPYNIAYIFTNTLTDSMVAGKYRIEAVNDLGCTDEVLLEIPSDCYVADLPTAFSPNGDKKNDLLLVRGMNIKEMHLRIYNRWGQLIFETRDQNTGWDGRYKGQNVPVEAYAFVLSVVFKNSEVFQKQGNITLLR